MRRGNLDLTRAQRTRRLLLWVSLIGLGCTNSGDPRAELRGPQDLSERPTGCIDTPFVGPDHRTSTLGVRCGREASPDAVLLRGRVVGETQSGLPGPGLEGVWVSVHAITGAVQLSHLPPARAEIETGPQGAFAISLTGLGEVLIVVRSDPNGPVLSARRVAAHADARTPELVLTVPLAEDQRERAAPTTAPAPSESTRSGAEVEPASESTASPHE